MRCTLVFLTIPNSSCDFGVPLPSIRQLRPGISFMRSVMTAFLHANTMRSHCVLAPHGLGSNVFRGGCSWYRGAKRRAVLPSRLTAIPTGLTLLFLCGKKNVFPCTTFRDASREKSLVARLGGFPLDLEAQLSQSHLSKYDDPAVT